MPETIEYRLVDSYLGSSVNTYNLSDGTYCKHFEILGRGVVEPDWAIDSAPQGLASRIHGLKLKPRQMTLRALWETSSEADADIRRDDLGKIFKPFDPAWESFFITNEVGAFLRINRAGGTTREIECYPTGMTDTPASVSDGVDASKINGRISVNLIAPDPTFYDPSAESYSQVSMSGSGSGSFSADIDGSTWFMYPRFEIEGPFTTLRIFNAAFGAEFTLNNVSGINTIVVETKPNIKSAGRIFTSPSYTDQGALLDDVTKGITSFYIPPQWYNNGATTDSISYSYTGGDSGSSLTMTYNKRFVNA